MSPSQILSLAFLFGLFPGYLAGAWCPWWLAGLPCYASALLVYRVALANEDTPVEVCAAWTASMGVLMGSFAAAFSVITCPAPHASGVVDGLDPCAAALLVGLAYGVHVWRDEAAQPTFPANLRGVGWVSFGLYLAAVGLALMMRGDT